jgi:hypothetical protein
MKPITLCSLGGAILAVAFLIYLPGLSGGFVFDDYNNILYNDAVKIDRLDFGLIKGSLLSGLGGYGGRPISMLSFGFNYYADNGFRPYSLKLVNVVIHLFNGIGVFLLSRYLLRIYQKTAGLKWGDRYVDILSLATAAVWLWHPLNLTSVLYVVQRMTSLSGLFTIGALILFCRGRLCMLNGASRLGRRWVLASLLLVPPAFLSKENGVLIPLFFGVIEFCLLRLKSAGNRDKAFLQGFFICTLALPFLVMAVTVIVNPDRVLAGFEGRTFTPIQRLLTESRVLWFYLYLIVLPNIRAMGLFHDDISISQDLLSPPETLISVAAVVIALVIGWRSRERQPLVALAIFGFLAGHSLESTILSLDIAYEHRNYIPQFFIILPTVYYIANGVSAISRRHLRVLTVVALFSLLPLITSIRAASWGEPLQLILTEAANHPKSAITQFEVGSLYDRLLLASPERTDRFYAESRRHFEKSIANDDKYLASLFALLVLSYHAKQPVLPDWIDRLAHALRNDPLSSNSVNSLIEFTYCQQKAQCHLPAEEMGRLLQAAIDNPRLRGQNRASVLACASKYLFSQVGNYKDSLRLAYWAIESNPKELQYRIDLIHLLILLDQRDTAKEEIALAKEKDIFHVYHGRLRELELML